MPSISLTRLDDILDASLAFWDAISHPALDNFRENINNWGETYIQLEATPLSAATHLFTGTNTISEPSQKIIDVFKVNNALLHWEQSYKKEDNVVGDDMLSDYGFAEILGKNGPFLSEKIRYGISIWGPNITYPTHYHKAEEIYYVLSGSADYHIGDLNQVFTADELVYVPANTPHGFSTSDKPYIALYLWQSGDLREISTFK